MKIPSIRSMALFTVLTLFLQVEAQFNITYQPLRCMGDIPSEFLKLGSQKALEETEQIKKKGLSKSEQELETTFANNSNFGVDAMLLSGKVLYGDPLTLYVNKVADKILESDTILRKELRFYVLKSSTVNAFATNQGVVFVTVGLLSHVKNEAQLAFILCHEVIHYVKRHNFEHYKKRKTLKNQKLWFGDFNFEQRLKMLYKHSRSAESEADKEGLKLFMKTRYKTSESLSGFDMLMVSHLPYEDMVWNISEFQDSLYVFPKKCTPSKGNPIVLDDNEDDEESTHPNIRKRKDALEKLIELSGIKGDSLYLLNRSYFDLVQKQARIEICFIHLNYAEYERAYYLSYLFRKIYGDSSFSSKIGAYAIYALSNKSEYSPFSYEDEEEDDDEKNDQGEYYYPVYFFSHLNKDEQRLLSVRYSWNALKNNPDDSLVRAVFKNSAKVLFGKSSYSRKELNLNFPIDSSLLTIKKKLKYSTTKDTSTSKDTGAYIPENLTKVEKLKLQKKLEESKDSTAATTVLSPSGEYTFYAFHIYQSDSSFIRSIKSEYEAHLLRIKILNEDTTETSFFYLDFFDWDYSNKFGKSGNTDSMLLINPGLKVYRFYKEEPRDHFYEESEMMDLNKLYLEMAGRTGVSAQLFNLLDRSNLTTDKINEYSILMDWITERYNNSSTSYMMFNSQYTGVYTNTPGREKVCFSNVVYSVDKSEFKASRLALFTVLAPLLPFYLYYTLHGTHELWISFTVFDLRTGETSFTHSRTYKMAYRKDSFGNKIYSLFRQLKKKSAKK